MKTTKTNRVLLIHGYFLVIVTLVNTVASLYGMKTGEGMFGFLKEMPFSEVGFFQAYMLMMIVGIVLILNAKSEQSWKYDLLSVVAHLVPLTALFMLKGEVQQIMGVKIFIASAAIHFPWVIVESITAYLQYKKAHETAVQ